MVSATCPPDACLLVVNAGSSSVKYKLFLLDTLESIKGGKYQNIGEPDSAFLTHEDAFRDLILQLIDHKVCAVVHRVVHGGADYFGPVRVTDDVLHKLEDLSCFAPLHQEHNVNGIRICQSIWSDIPQFADFDTAFHFGHNPVFDAYALPASYRDKGLKKYGFHGLSYQYLCTEFYKIHPDKKSDRIVFCHLGNGSSLCAVKDGKSIDTTMGLTALDGLPMGTRSGSIDPGLVLYLMQNEGMSADKVSEVLYNESGLLGLSGISNDMKTLTSMPSAEAEFAIAYYCHKVVQHILMMSASLGGMDAVVFSGGIGENSLQVREYVLSSLGFMPSFTACVIPTNEEWSMAYNIKEYLKNEQATF
ncbi:MAG: hypothetical protein RBR86_00775 [Pseudobdellovibrionaceae bacterium]|jgi:acetate kinase|nr:hypothetical protein [Pseudobdellovibrionaceae bacterium]